MDGPSKIDSQTVFRVQILTIPSKVSWIFFNDYLLDMEGSWDIRQISSCNNGTIMIDKDMKTRVIFSGSLKGGSNQGSEDHQKIEFKTPLKFVTAGKMSVGLVLENDEIFISGHNKDSHYDQTETE